METGTPYALMEDCRLLARLTEWVDGGGLGKSQKLAMPALHLKRRMERSGIQVNHSRLIGLLPAICEPVPNRYGIWCYRASDLRESLAEGGAGAELLAELREELTAAQRQQRIAEGRSAVIPGVMEQPPEPLAAGPAPINPLQLQRR